MRRVPAFVLVVLVGVACSSGGGNEPGNGNGAVTNSLRTLDTLVRRAEESTLTFSRAEPFSQQAKITFSEAYRDWGQVRFQARLAFTPAQLEQDEQLRPTLAALVSAADAWVRYLEFIEPSVEGETSVDMTRANEMLVEAKKKGVVAKSALQEALQGTS